MLLINLCGLHPCYDCFYALYKLDLSNTNYQWEYSMKNNHSAKLERSQKKFKKEFGSWVEDAIDRNKFRTKRELYQHIATYELNAKHINTVINWSCGTAYPLKPLHAIKIAALTGIKLEVANPEFPWRIALKLLKRDYS